MVFDTLSPLMFIFTMLQNLQGPDGPLLQSVDLGAPSSLTDRVSAFVAIGEQQVDPFTLAMLKRDAAYYIGFGYRVDTNQSVAESSLAVILDTFITAFYRDRTLGGTADESADIDLSLTKTPTYLKVALQEFRIYAVLVRVRQYQSSR